MLSTDDIDSDKTSTMTMRPTWVARLSVMTLLLVPVVRAEAQLSAQNPACTNAHALTLMNPDAIACSGAWNGNDVNQRSAVLSQLDFDFHQFVGNGAWTYLGTTNAGSASGPFGTVPGTVGGTLSFDSRITGFFALALKSSTNFSLYLFDGGSAGLASVDFTTIGTSLNRRGSAQALSHASLYDFDAASAAVVPPPAAPPAAPPTPTEEPVANAVIVTPEPGVLALMLTGFAILGATVRRRRV